MKLIPAIDIIGGKCVRLTQGDFGSTKTYNENPLEVAKQFEDAGLQHLHLVDLDGAREKRMVNYAVLETLATQTRLHIDFGGGIRTDADVKRAFTCGAAQITAGSIAVQEPITVERWLKNFGAEKIILGADCKNGKIATQGWQTTSELNVLDFILAFEKKGMRYAISTDVAKDGMLGGPAWELYENILANSAIQLIASGGVTTIQDLIALKKTGCYGAIIGKALYEGRITLKDLSALC